MKIITRVISGILLCSLVLSGCDKLENRGVRGEEIITEERKEARETFHQLMDSIESGDKSSIKNMFSMSVQNDIENIDSMIEELLEFYQGDMVSYNDWSGPSVYAEGGYGIMTKKVYESSFNVSTSEGEYQLSFQDIKMDEDNPENVGLSSLYIVSDTYVDPTGSYWGDGKWTAGIMFNLLYDDTEDEQWTQDLEESETFFEMLIENIEKKDVEAIKNMFSLAVDAELGEEIVQLLSFYKGNMSSYEDWDDLETFEENGVKFSEAYFRIQTNEENYQMALRRILEDKKEPNNAGIESIYIIEDYGDGSGMTIEGDWRDGITLDDK